MDKQKTAVEWQYIELSKFLTGFSEFTHKSDILIKAKEMEKEQIKSAFNIGELMAHDYFYGNDECAENYYNETYGGNK
jgi:hypothetical protein